MTDRQIKVLIRARRKSKERVYMAFATPICMVIVALGLMWGAV